MKNNKPILLFQRVLPSYRVGVFKVLQNDLGIIPCFSNEKRGHSLKSEQNVSGLQTEVLKSYYPGKSVTFMIQPICKVLLKYKPEIVICEGASSYLTLWMLFILKPFFRYKIITWSHGIKNQEIFKPFSSRSSKFALKLMKLADSNILYSHNRKKILSNYINKPDKVFVAPNTLEVTDLLKHSKDLKLTGKQAIKKQLNWNTQYNLIFVGRLIKSKQVDFLIAVLEQIPESINVSLQIVGDGPELESLKLKAHDESRIVFHGGIIEKEIVGKMLFASDLMIIPGYIGLALVHSFVYGCPIITSKTKPDVGPFHSPEFEYLVNGKNGFVIEQEVKIYVDKILNVIQDIALQDTLSKNAEDTVQSKANMDIFISAFKNAIKFVR